VSPGKLWGLALVALALGWAWLFGAVVWVLS
jgi:hypothetical protein